MTLLCELADKYQTDKGGKSTMYGGSHGDTCHTYTEVYHARLVHHRNAVKKVLEIGVNAGGSLRMWKEFFPNAHIYGLDVRPETMYQEDRITTILADQGDKASLIRAVGATGPGDFGLIIDDGSHELGHQLTSMYTLLPFLSLGGLYVIEDVGGMHCDHSAISSRIPEGFEFESVDCPNGIGKAHCPVCKGPEALFLIHR